MKCSRSTSVFTYYILGSLNVQTTTILMQQRQKIKNKDQLQEPSFEVCFGNVPILIYGNIFRYQPLSLTWHMAVIHTKSLGFLLGLTKVKESCAFHLSFTFSVSRTR